MKIKLALLIAFAGFSAGASAEIAEFSFKDTLNVKKTVSPASVWINPVTSFDVAVISGLDRYITLSLLKSDGSLIWSTKSSLVTVDDRTTSSTGFDYYGKTLTVPAMGEDSFTLREVITDLQGKEVSRQDYPLAIDRTPPATGTISYTRNGWNFGSEAIFTPAPAMEIAPKIVAKEMYRSDTSEWLTQASISVKTATISRIKVTAEPRPYVQKFRTVKNAAWFCTIPVGQSSCEMTVNFNYTSDKGFEYLHLYSGKDGDSIFDALAGNFTVIWDNNPPVVNVAQVNKASKTITMTATDNDRVNAWNISYWDTKVFEATLKNARGETFTLKPVTVSESDYKTKNATFSYAGLPDGDYTVVSVSATDLVGNTGTKTLNAPLKIDSTLPVIAFSFNGADAEGKLVKGLENLRISVTDASGDASLISLQLAGGPNSEKVTLAFTPLSKDVFIPEYPRIFPNTDESGQMYHLEALAIDESGNRTTKTLNFTYQPANLIMLDNLKTLATAVALKATDNTPLAIIRTSVLRRQDGSIITGQLNGTLTVQKNAQFGVTVAGVTVQPGETKSLSLDLGNGEERTYPVTPAVSGQSGTATFTIEFPQT
ncbi:TPA: Ig-like domain-containing protein [Enterobacter hormaechei]